MTIAANGVTRTADTARSSADHHWWFAHEPSTLILQPTTLCNLNCVYCYLPERLKKQSMSPGVARAIAAGIPDEWPTSRVLDVVWHGGEPLTIGMSELVKLMEPFEGLRVAGRVKQVIQTNATLITDEWCDVFEAFDVAVGVSVDGPSEATTGRVDWRGRPAFDRIMRGIETLKRREIAFTVIAVVGKSQIGQARQILDFLAEIGCPYVGLNIEEQEGVNKHAGTPTIDQARAFWRDVVEWTYEHPGMGVREVDELFSFLSLADGDRASDTQHDLIPTIGWNGDVVLLSPELLGTHAPSYGNFVAGNVLTDSLPTIIDRAHELRYINEFATGIENCKATCEFFALCQGSHACNRYFEHNNFTTTETEHCKTSTQALVLALADLTQDQDPSKEKGVNEHDDPRTTRHNKGPNRGRSDRTTQSNEEQRSEHGQQYRVEKRPKLGQLETEPSSLEEEAHLFQEEVTGG